MQKDLEKLDGEEKDKEDLLKTQTGVSETPSPSKYDKAARTNFKNNILSAIGNPSKLRRPRRALSHAKSTKINVVNPVAIPVEENINPFSPKT